MEDKTLKSKAIQIKGKDYVMVKDRIAYFNDNYENGCITTKVESDNGEEIVFQAKVTPDVTNENRFFTGYASGVRGGEGVDSTSAVENAETSAVGRALAMMGIGILDSIASGDEMNKAMSHKNYKERKSTEGQVKYLKSLGYKGLEEFAPENLTFEEASQEIDRLVKGGSDE